MTKRRTWQREQELFGRLLDMSNCAVGEASTDWSRTGIQMKKFRFQLLHQWLTGHLAPCHVADIGGGKGLLSYLLIQSGWESTVIDPVRQDLPGKYKDAVTGRRVLIPASERVPRIDREFQPQMAARFDLLVGMHAHGCNAVIVDAASQYGCGFVLLPCCVIDEPFYPRLGVHWLESVLDYALRAGHQVCPFRLQFRGQNIGFFCEGRAGTTRIGPVKMLEEERRW